MTIKLYGNAGFSFMNWKPAKDQLRELLETKKVKVYHVRDLPVSFGGTRLEAFIEQTPDMNLSDLIASLEHSRAAVNINVTIYTGPPPDDQPPIPASPWWESLVLTEPKTRIYAAQNGVQVYQSAGENVPPTFDQKALLNTGQPWTLPLGKSVEVHRAPVAGSGWICVAVLAERALWVRGEDMRATP